MNLLQIYTSKLVKVFGVNRKVSSVVIKTKGLSHN